MPRKEKEIKKVDVVEVVDTKQLTLLDFNVLAEEIKTLTKNILDNRWKIAEKLFYIKNHWDEYKKQDSFLYKTFQQFIKDYYGWTRNESQVYIEAHKFKELLSEKCNTGVTFESLVGSIVLCLFGV
jgi:ribosomal protein S4